MVPNGFKDVTDRVIEVLTSFGVPFRRIDMPVSMRFMEGEEPFDKDGRTHTKPICVQVDYFMAYAEFVGFLEAWDRAYTLFLYQATECVSPTAAKHQQGHFARDLRFTEVLRGTIRLRHARDDITDEEFEREARQWREVDSLDPMKNFGASTNHPTTREKYREMGVFITEDIEAAESTLRLPGESERSLRKRAVGLLQEVFRREREERAAALTDEALRSALKDRALIARHALYADYADYEEMDEYPLIHGGGFANDATSVEE